MSKNNEYLKILGLDDDFKNLSPKEQEKALAKAWRKFSMKWHPDINKSSHSEKKFKQGNEANEKLKEAIKNGEFKFHKNEKQTNYEYKTKDKKTDNSYGNYNTYSYAQTSPKDNNYFRKCVITMIIIMASFCLCSMESNKTPKYPITKVPTEQTIQSETKLETETKTETKSENEEQENQQQEEESAITSIIQEDIEEETGADETAEEKIIDESDQDVIY